MSNNTLVSFARTSFAAAFALGTALAFASPAAAQPTPTGLGCEAGYTLVIEADVLTCEGTILTGKMVPLASKPTCTFNGGLKPILVTTSGADYCTNGSTISCGTFGGTLTVNYSGTTDMCVKLVPESVPDYQSPFDL